jgi:hypothetical protein
VALGAWRTDYPGPRRLSVIVARPLAVLRCPANGDHLQCGPDFLARGSYRRLLDSSTVVLVVAVLRLLLDAIAHSGPDLDGYLTRLLHLDHVLGLAGWEHETTGVVRHRVGNTGSPLLDPLPVVCDALSSVGWALWHPDCRGVTTLLRIRTLLGWYAAGRTRHDRRLGTLAPTS